MDYQEKILRLFDDQKENWDILKKNTQSLFFAREKKFDFKGYSVKIQFNPERIISSSARVDKDSIEERPCFLCEHNRPAQQASISFNTDYEFLCNPYPIFKKHFTISHKDHIPQEIKLSFPSMLDISKALPELVVFYNAPNCGASAPDHLHFQAGNLNFLPLEADYENISELYGKTLLKNVFIKITAIDDGLRRFLVLESDNKDELIRSFKNIYDLTTSKTKNEEPMLNILSYYRSSWKVFIFLRDLHRPSQYFTKGEENILLSPASVDYGGMLITPLEKDFNKLTQSDIEDIFNQVSIDRNKFEEYQKLLIKS